jgi:putative ATP-dependent endonuclease of OLD family
MRIARLVIENFRGIKSARLHFDGHTLLIGRNNVGKSTICEALELVLSPDRISRFPPVEEFDFFNAKYLAEDGTPIPLSIEVILTELTEEVTRLCFANLEHWHTTEGRLLDAGELAAVDAAAVQPCLRLATIAQYDPEEDQFVAKTVFPGEAVEEGAERRAVPSRIKRSIGFLYLRALRTGSRALSLERGSLLDIILRMKELRTGLWERIRTRLATLDPPIDSDATELRPILDEIEGRLSEYIETSGADGSTRLHVSQLTREHLRKTMAFFLTMGAGETAIPFQEAGTGTLNVLVLALLTFIADIKKDNVIFAMEEPEIALPPQTQRRIAKYLLAQTTQCFVTSHSPFVIEQFTPEQIVRLCREADGQLSAISVKLPEGMKEKTYRRSFRRALSEAMLGAGVIVGEGLTERDAIVGAAAKLEEEDSSLFPFDVAGVTIIDAEGDGNLERLGEFFKTIGIPAFAFFDKKQRTDAEVDALEAIFDLACEQPHKGAEKLLAMEIPLDNQWQFLEALRVEDVDGTFGIPAARPGDNDLRDHTLRVLKGMKGAGGAARLIDLCTAAEIPAVLRDFLRAVYANFPRPERKVTVEEHEEVAAHAAAEGTPEATTPAPA